MKYSHKILTILAGLLIVNTVACEANNQTVSLGLGDSLTINFATPSPAITVLPSTQPIPTNIPSVIPTFLPTLSPIITPIPTIAVAPTPMITIIPSIQPTVQVNIPTIAPTIIPTVFPSLSPISTPTPIITIAPTQQPTIMPTTTPSPIPTTQTFAGWGPGIRLQLGFSEFGSYAGNPSASTYSQSKINILGQYIQYDDRYSASSNGGITVTNALKAVGIQLGNYTDPSLVCISPFHNPDNSINTSCGFSNYRGINFHESSFAHTGNGVPNPSNRLYVNDSQGSDGHNSATDFLNPMSLVNDYNQFELPPITNDGSTFAMADNIYARSNFWNGLFTGSQESPNQIPITNAAIPYPGYSDSAFFLGVTQFLNNTTIPIIPNGCTDQRLATAVVNSPKALGCMLENSYSNGSVGQSRAKEIQPFWGNSENSQIILTSGNKIAYHFIHTYGGIHSNDIMMFALASELLTYKHGYTALQVDGNFPDDNQIAYFPGNWLVPTNPVIQTITDISQLQDSPNGAYIREYLNGFIRGFPINKVAVVVNPSQTTVPMPARVIGNYTRVLSLDFYQGQDANNNPIYKSGIPELGAIGSLTTTPIASIPTTIAPQESCIFIQ